MFKCLRGSAPAYLADYCTSTSLVPGRSALRSAAHGDIVCTQSSDWLGFEIFCGGWPQQLECFACWFEVFLFWFRYICKALIKTHLFGLAYSRQSTHFWVCITFCRVRHGDSVTKPDYYYYYAVRTRSTAYTNLLEYFWRQNGKSWCWRLQYLRNDNNYRDMGCTVW